MKLILVGLVLVMVVGAHAGFPLPFKGNLFRHFRDLREDNSDLHENYDAAKMDPGEKLAPEVVSTGMESTQGMTDHGNEDAAADQEANHRGRNA